MKMSWLLGSEWNKVRCPGVFKKIVKWLKVVCGLEICVCVHLTKENKFLPQKNGCHLNALGKHKHDLLPSCWLFWLNVRWCRSTKPKPKPKQVVEYSEISKETSELREGGRSDNSVHSIKRENKEKKNNYLVKILGWYTNFLNIFAGWYTEWETFATISSQEISCRWKSSKIQRHKKSKCLIRESIL